MTDTEEFSLIASILIETTSDPNLSDPSKIDDLIFDTNREDLLFLYVPKMRLLFVGLCPHVMQGKVWIQ